MSISRDPRNNFYANPTVDELLDQQGIEPLTDPTVVLGHFWPENEPVEDFLAALRM
jgi:hypothetical protein